MVTVSKYLQVYYIMTLANLGVDRQHVPYYNIRSAPTT